MEADQIWRDSQILFAGEPAASDRFGTSVAIDGDTAICTSYRCADDGGQGHAYVYRKNDAGIWFHVATLSPIEAASDGYGRSVAINGGAAIVGGRGLVYAYSDDGSNHWSQASQLLPNDIPGRQFGYSVDMNNGVAIVGDPSARSVSGSGAAYIFRKNEVGGWVQAAKLIGYDVPVFNGFGSSVAL